MLGVAFSSTFVISQYNAYLGHLNMTENNWVVFLRVIRTSRKFQQAISFLPANPSPYGVLVVHWLLRRSPVQTVVGPQSGSLCSSSAMISSLVNAALLLNLWTSPVCFIRLDMLVGRVLYSWSSHTRLRLGQLTISLIGSLIGRVTLTSVRAPVAHVAI